MDKNRSHFLARFRGLDPGSAPALLTNIHLPNFLKRHAVSGLREVCLRSGAELLLVPRGGGGLSLSELVSGGGRVVESFEFSYYVTGILILLGVLLGRFICGFLCPFGWLQELLHKIPVAQAVDQDA